MLASEITESALRSAVITGIKNNKGDIAKSIEEAAVDRATTLLQANCTGSSFSMQSATQLTLISAAVATIAISYKVISEQAIEMKQKRVSFDNERKAGIATFYLPRNIEAARYSEEEKIIDSFLKLLNPLSRPSYNSRYIQTYLGINRSELSEKSDYEFYSVIPFYRMSQGISQPLSSQKPIDMERTAIGLFFKAPLTRIFKNIDDDFQTDWTLPQICSSAYQKENYLNNRRAPRFIMMCLGNLLWNLQHPVDLDSGFPLSTSDTLQVCRSAELFLSSLLDETQPPFIKYINNDTNCLISVIRQVEVKIKALRAAYAYEQIHELNIADINHTGHHSLRLMDTSLLKLIYKTNNPTTGKDEPDELAADSIAYIVSYLNQLLHRNKDRSILKIFNQYHHLAAHSTGLNKHTQSIDGQEIKIHTIIDIMIIFCHMRTKDRHQLLEALIQKKEDSSEEFALTLTDFYKHYLKPIKRFTEKEVGSNWRDAKENEVVEKTARRLIPIISLVLADYRVNVDMDWPYLDFYIRPTFDDGEIIPSHSYLYIEDSKKLFHIIPDTHSEGHAKPIKINDNESFLKTLKEINSSQQKQFLLTKKNVYDLITANCNHVPEYINPNILGGNQQIQNINTQANEDGGYYHWSLAKLFSLEGESEKKFNDLPKQQYRMTQMTQLMDQVMGLISEYRSLLQSYDFQKFLIHFMKIIKYEYEETGRKIAILDDALGEDEKISRGLNEILRPLIDALDRSIRGFTNSVTHFEKIISAPDFVKKQRRILNQKLELIESLYKKLFDKDEGTELISKLIKKQEASPTSYLPNLQWDSKETSENTTERLSSSASTPPILKSPANEPTEKFKKHQSSSSCSSRKTSAERYSRRKNENPPVSDSFLLMLLNHPVIKVVSAVLFIAGVAAMTMGYLGLLGLGIVAMQAGAFSTAAGLVGYTASFWKSKPSPKRERASSPQYEAFNEEIVL